jgi:aryl-alcohol dehydrogenase-like predicted oxidoreductase
MKHRSLGKSGIEASEIGLGCWQLGGDFGPVDDARADAILATALDVGIDFWDTADVYGAGQSEARIGRFLKGRSERVQVATKLGRGGSLYPDGYTREAMRASLQGSAERLGVECLDLAQLHCVPTEVMRDGEVLEWMAEFQDQGLVQAFGASVETLEEAELAMRHPRLASLQLIVNLFRQDALETLFPRAQAQDVGIIVRLPLASGLLSGKMSAQRQFDPGDHRAYNREGQAFSRGETFSGLDFDAGLALVDALRDEVPKAYDMAQWALRWLLDQDAVTTVIAGATRPDQVQSNAATSSLPALDTARHAWLADFYRERVRAKIRVPI